MKQYEEWLIKAESDLKTAKKLIAGDDPIFDTATYHTQQCAEKALKAYLSFKQNPILKIHDLGDLVEICMKYNKKFAELMDDADALTPYSIMYRYPPSFGSPDENEVKMAIEKAEKILNFVKMEIQRESQ
ncbi:MAG: HEPN domain-containing protein [Thermodesulfovibrio sp.]|nr:HEPN domain-containing protein [Thermodesulfovibrio sp.]MDW7998476.1 HEPN domain-containing protein [Thermodesulfovibrio sp.]